MPQTDQRDSTRFYAMIIDAGIKEHLNALTAFHPRKQAIQALDILSQTPVLPAWPCKYEPLPAALAGPEFEGIK